MRAHLVQYDIVWEDKPANHAIVRRMLDEADPDPGDLILLPEMFDTGFSMRTECTAANEELTVGFLADLAQDHACWVLASSTTEDPRYDSTRPFVNRAGVHDPSGRRVLESDKIHPFSFGRESERYAGGDRVGAIPIGRDDQRFMLCPVVCYDLRFPELFRSGVDRGAEVFGVIANWPSARQDHWRALAIARAIENQAFVLALNRCGSDPKLSYAGGSLVVDPLGAVCTEAGTEPTVLSIELRMDVLREWRATFPALRDRRAWNIGGDDSCGGRICSDRP